MNKELKELLTTLFAHHPDVDVFYLTADHAAFTESVQADSHAQRLKSEKVMTFTRTAFQLGEPALETERAQEAPEGKVKGVDTIPSEVKDLEIDGNKDAATALTQEVKEVKEELKETKGTTETKQAATEAVKEQQKSEPTAEDKAKAEKRALAIRYEEVLGKKPAPQYDVAKMQELIDAKIAEGNQ